MQQQKVIFITGMPVSGKTVPVKELHRTHTPEFEMGRTLKIDATHFPLPMDKICAFIDSSDTPKPNSRTSDGR